MEKIKADEFGNFTCKCGNAPDTDGFYPCDSKGKYIEPCIDEGWVDL